jgi:hypothetical protein
MAIIDFPGFRTGPVSLALENDVQMTTARNGRVLTYSLPGSRWAMTINFENELETMQRPAIEAFLVSLRGGANRVRMHHMGRPRPNGTLTGSPTLSGTVAGGATALPMNNCNGGVKRGDMLGFHDELFMVTADVDPVANAMTVPVWPAVRVTRGAGTAVAWDKPAAVFVPRSSVAGPFPYMPNGVRPGFAIELIEAW